jgi:hypothetical protein
MRLGGEDMGKNAAYLDGGSRAVDLDVLAHGAVLDAPYGRLEVFGCPRPGQHFLELEHSGSSSNPVLVGKLATGAKYGGFRGYVAVGQTVPLASRPVIIIKTGILEPHRPK